MCRVRSCFFFFFFQSRRRHTRYWRDWSSDVCSSDLPTSRSLGAVSETFGWPEIRQELAALARADDPDERHERRLLVGVRLHRRADAEELLRVVDADTPFRAATRTSPR